MDLSRKPRLQHLDMLRGLCALGVVISHLRALLVVPYAEAARHGLFDKLLFALGGLGHECVIAFFALSGFLVGGSTLAAMRAGRFSLADYGVARLSRLWTVLVPALALTALWDALGALLGPAGAYQGALAAILESGPTAREPATHSLVTLLGNLLFLQTIETPVFGSNRPLWSLANEAWYYLVFPLLAFTFFHRAPIMRALCAAAGALALALLPGELALLGLPWLAGALAADNPARPSLARALAGALATLAALGVSHMSRTVLGDIALGCAIAFWLRDLAAFPSIGGLYAAAAHGVSEISYTLYAVHFPLLLMLWFWLLAPARSQPGLAVLGQMAILMAVALIYAAAVWFLFERRTDVVRGWLLRRLRAPRGAPVVSRCAGVETNPGDRQSRAERNAAF
ncbi:acyltransferase family protein [Methylosinus sporium]|uniref:Acyltransferase n=1 Tax=Methylosinus sporium TaxID=428 RepID=A0A2U1SN83_METSR|nr:acyltransferase [Methylosinus sporium]PWB93069.1 acyltransferase [Methylosinus sporium]